jgi:hypothetical protein
MFVSEFDILKGRAHAMAAHLIERVIEEPAMKSMEATQIEPLLQSLVVDMRGTKITRNICQIVDQAKYESIGAGENYSNRSWFIEPVKDGKIHVTDLYSSKITGALCITVSGTIRNQIGEIIGILGLDIRFEDLTRSED